MTKHDSGRHESRPMPEEARRALAEAAQRQHARTAGGESLAREVSGRKGPEPTRYGDWEKKGIASDF